MCRKWKKTAALGLAVLIGGMTPMSTMLAAEDNTEVAQEIETDSVFDADAVPDDETISYDNESIVDEVNPEDGNVGGEVNADDAIADDEVDPVNEQNIGIKVMSASDVAEAGDTEENTDAPVIDITLNGESCKVDGLSGGISYKYTNVSNSKFGLSASLNNKPILFRYYLDDNPGDEAKDNDNIPWSGKCSSMDWGLTSNKSYVVYMKAEGNGQTVYARSCGVVVDTTAPEIVGLKEGETYPAGTTFKVEDANLDVVMVNETLATPESDGSYKVAANGTSCVIRAKDKAGNEKTCSITVSGGEEPGTGDEEPGTGDEKPGTGDEEPGTGDEKPGTGDEEPGTGDEEPGTGDEKPGTGDEEPGTGDEKPGTGDEEPGAGDEKPGTGDETPETDIIISESGMYALKAGVKYHLAAGNWKVDGDKSVYQGDSDFYVKEDGNYKFTNSFAKKQ